MQAKAIQASGRLWRAVLLTVALAGLSGLTMAAVGVEPDAFRRGHYRRMALETQ
nr:hypothetical protein [Chloroflexota bacterium]